MNTEATIFVAGHRGLAGSAILRELQRIGCKRIVTRARNELDLLDFAAVRAFYKDVRPDYVYVAAAKVGGIMANKTYPASFLFENLQIQNHLIHGAYEAGVKKLLFLGSSCIYPKLAKQPITEDELLSGPLEPTNDAYALAKIAGLKMCEAYRKQYGCDFIAAMPTNLFGINDNYDLQNSHVLAALIRRFHEALLSRADKVTLWGTGKPLREFLFSDDLARGCVFLMERYREEKFINLGSGIEVSIRELAETIRRVVGFEGRIEWDESKPDGTPRKIMDSARILQMGWRPEVGLEEGIRVALADYRQRFGV